MVELKHLSCYQFKTFKCKSRAQLAVVQLKNNVFTAILFYFILFYFILYYFVLSGFGLLVYIVHFEIERSFSLSFMSYCYLFFHRRMLAPSHKEAFVCWRGVSSRVTSLFSWSLLAFHSWSILLWVKGDVVSWVAAFEDEDLLCGDRRAGSYFDIYRYKRSWLFRLLKVLR